MELWPDWADKKSQTAHIADLARLRISLPHGWLLRRWTGFCAQGLPADVPHRGICG